MIEEDLKEVKDFLTNNVLVEKSLKFETHKNLRIQRKLQHFFSKKFSNKRAQKIYEVVLDHVQLAERIYPDSGISLIKKFCDLECQKFNQPVRTKNDILQKIKSMDMTEKSMSLLTEILDHCTSATRIKIKKSVNEKTYIELTNSYHFNAQSLIKHKKDTCKNAKVICVDGFVENVSEIHHILHHFSTNEKGRPFLFFCRGMSDDVLNTLSVNNQRGAIECYPVKINFDLEDVNTLVDIAVVAGIDVISSLKGELISAIKIDSLKDVDVFSFVKDGILIKNLKTKLDVDRHVRNLKKKSEDAPDATKDYLYQRIKSLSANSIDVALPDDINFFAFSQEIDAGIRLIMSVINNKTDSKEVENLYYKKLINSLNDIGELI